MKKGNIMTITDVVAGLVARYLPTKSVDTIVSVVTKLIAKLDAAEAAQNAKAAALKRQADKLTKAASVATAEASRAAALRSNFTALTTPSA